MQVIAITNRKGGVGKTTIAGHLAVEAARGGHSPALIDTDPQGTLAEWWNERQAEDVKFANVRIEDLDGALQQLEEEGIQLVIIDTPPNINATIKAAIALADHVLIPVRPSPHDLRAVRRTLKLVQDAQKPFSFALNGCSARSLTDDALAALEGATDEPPVVLGQRVAFVRSMIDGRVAVEVDKRGKAAQEVAALWQQLSNQLGK